MRYRQLGESGLTVSMIGLGGNNVGSRIGLEETRGVVDAAIDCGVTLIDTADVYGVRGRDLYGNRGGSEELLGQVLAGRREHVVLATKFGMDMGEGTVVRGSRTYIRRAVDASLHRLQTDYIDLYQYHASDGLTPLEETLATLDDLVTEGKVCYIGSSNFAGWQIADAEWIARTHQDRARSVRRACATTSISATSPPPLAATHGLSLKSLKHPLHIAGVRRTSLTRRATRATPPATHP